MKAEEARELTNKALSLDDEAKLNVEKTVQDLLGTIRKASLAGENAIYIHVRGNPESTKYMLLSFVDMGYTYMELFDEAGGKAPFYKITW